MAGANTQQYGIKNWRIYREPIDGEAVRTAQMIVTPAAVEQYFNVASCVYIDVPTGCCSTAGVTNTSTQAINVQNATLIVERVA